MDAMKLIMVGGFLGAGKTTMLARLAKILDGQGKRCGLITNDQAADLVDTAILSRSGNGIQEVSGSCFCCNFPGFEQALSSLKSSEKIDLIIAEPVGSCTDLSATIIQPLKDKYKDEYKLAPFSVLVDPKRLTDIINGGCSGLHASSAYIVRKQMEEADMIVINKSDLLSEEDKAELIRRTEDAYTKAKVYCVSAQEGDGVEEWLNDLMTLDYSGRNLTKVDYDIYAEGEAVLGWLNSEVNLSGSADWDKVLKDFVDGLEKSFRENRQGIGHLKMLLLDDERESFALVNLTGGEDAVRFRGHVESCEEAYLIINARVEMPPEELQDTVFKVLDGVLPEGVAYNVERVESLMPGRPNPTYHYDQVVG